jgi:hypothetical protein
MIMSFQSDEHHEFGINLDNLSSYTFEDGNVKISMANGDVPMSGEVPCMATTRGCGDSS